MPAFAALALGLASCSDRHDAQLGSTAPSDEDAQVGSTAPSDEEVDRFILAEMRSRRIPGLSLAVLRDGTILKLKGYGVASRESAEPATEDTVYRLASTTKPFTAVAVMRLVEEGRLGLEDPIGDLLPDLPDSWQRVTVHQLLSHTSGLPDALADPLTGSFLGDTRDETLRKAAQRPPVSRPGERPQYIQTGYLLLGMIVETLTDQAFTDFMQQRFFGPLGMDSTSYGDPERVPPGHAIAYTSVDFREDYSIIPLEELEPLGYRFPDFAAPCATLNASARDLASWETALCRGRLLKEPTLERMWTPSEGSVMSVGKQPASVGCGWVLTGPAHHRTAWHHGGAATVYKRYLDDQLTIVILTNCQGAMPKEFVDRLAAIYRVEK